MDEDELKSGIPYKFSYEVSLLMRSLIRFIRNIHI